MAYIESFLLYILVVVTAFIIIIVPIILIIWTLSKLKFFNKRKLFQVLFLNEFRLKENKSNLETNSSTSYYKSIFRSRFVVMFTIIYFFAFGFSYIKQSFTYYEKDRAYPQAKAYAIVGNTVFLFHSLLLNNHRLFIPENCIDKKIIRLQDYILNKMYEYIPEDDVERDYWEYKFKYLYIVKLRYVPLKKEDRESSYFEMFLTMESGEGEYLPHFLTIMDEMHKISKNLFMGKSKDKVINDEKKYLPIAQMSKYLLSKMKNYKTKIKYERRIETFYKDSFLFQKYIDYTNFLMRTQELINSSAIIKKAIDTVPFSQFLLYTSIIEGLNNIMIYNTIHDIYVCTSRELELYLKYHKEFYNWIHSYKSSFKNISRREQKDTRFLFSAVGGEGTHYHLAKYFCEIPIDYLMPTEKTYLKVGGEKLLKSGMNRFNNKKRYRFEKFEKMKKNIEENK